VGDHTNESECWFAAVGCLFGFKEVSVRRPDPNLLWQLRDTEGVQEVEVNTPSLEDIFVAYLTSDIEETDQSVSELEPPRQMVDSKLVDSANAEEGEG